MGGAEVRKRLFSPLSDDARDGETPRESLSTLAKLARIEDAAQEQNLVAQGAKKGGK